MTENSPHFDIIIPTIGRPSLFRAIQSVVDQTYLNFTINLGFNSISEEQKNDIIVNIDNRWPNNGFNKYIYKHITLEQLAYERAAYVRNDLVHKSKNWIVNLDDDDLYLPNHLEVIASTIQKNPNVNMIKTCGQQFKMGHKHTKSKKLIMKLGSINTTDIMTVGMAFTREIFKCTTGWRPGHGHDQYLWLEMLEAGGSPICLDAVTFLYER